MVYIQQILLQEAAIKMNDLDSEQSLIEKPTVYGINLQRINHRGCTPLKSQFSVNQPTIEGASFFERTFSNNWLIPSSSQDRNSRMQKKYQKQQIIGRIKNNKKDIIKEIQDGLPLMKKENNLENNHSRVYQNDRKNNPLSIQKFSLNLHELKNQYYQKQTKNAKQKVPNPKKEVLLNFLENPNQNKTNTTIFFNPNYNLRPFSKVVQRDKRIEVQPKLESAKQISLSPISQKKVRKISVLSLSQSQQSGQILGLQSQLGQKQRQKQNISKIVKSSEKKKKQKSGGGQMAKKVKTESDQMETYEKKIQDLKLELQKSNNIIKDMKIKELQSEVIKLKQKDKEFDKILGKLIKQKQANTNTMQRLYRNNSSESRPMNYKDYRFDTVQQKKLTIAGEQKKFHTLDTLEKQGMGKSLNGLEEKRLNDNKGRIRKINPSIKQQQQLYHQKRMKTEGNSENKSSPKSQLNIEKKQEKKYRPIIVKQEENQKEKTGTVKKEKQSKSIQKQEPKFHILADHQSQMQIQSKFKLINPLKTRQKLQNSYAQLRKLSIPEINVNPFKIPQIPSPPLPNQDVQSYINKARDLCIAFDFQFSELQMIIRRYRDCISFKILGTQDIAIWSFDGKLYIGGWIEGKEGEGKKQGKGMEFSSNYYYKGQFKQNKKWGSGIAQYYNGNIYEGQWIQGKMDGKGVYFDKQNSIYYKGQWSKGDLIGRGIIKYTKKLYYTGQIKRFEKSGKGTQFYENGSIFQGSFQKGQINGYGVFYYPNGEFFVGNFKNGKRNGIGLLLTNKFTEEEKKIQNSNKKIQQYYYGYFADGLRAGYGIHRFLDDTYYMGYFFKDLQHGPGIIQKSAVSSGQTSQLRVTGMWKNGSIVIKNYRQPSEKVATSEVLNN